MIWCDWLFDSNHSRNCLTNFFIEQVFVKTCTKLNCHGSKYLRTPLPPAHAKCFYARVTKLEKICCTFFLPWLVL